MKETMLLSLIVASLSVSGMVSEKELNHKPSQRFVKVENPYQLQLRRDLWKILKKKNVNTKQLGKLIDSGININCLNNHGDTPFLYAVRTYRNRLLGFLLKYPKVNVNALDPCGNTSIIIAAKYKDIDMVRQLMNNIHYEKADILKLLYAYKHQQPWSNNQMQEYMNERKKRFINIQNRSGITALHKATLCGNFKLAEFLIENGANVNRCTIRGDTSLTIAIRKSNIKLAKYLIENGADINEISIESSPVTTKKCGKKILECLLNYCADINKIDPSLIAEIKNQKEKIIEYGTVTNNERGILALIMTIESGFVEVIKHFMSNGVAVEQTDAKEQISLGISEKERNQILINFLQNWRSRKYL